MRNLNPEGISTVAPLTLQAASHAASSAWWIGMLNQIRTYVISFYLFSPAHAHTHTHTQLMQAHKNIYMHFPMLFYLRIIGDSITLGTEWQYGENGRLLGVRRGWSRARQMWIMSVIATGGTLSLMMFMWFALIGMIFSCLNWSYKKW